MSGLLFDLAVGLGMGLLGAVVFAAIGLVSGTDETAVIAPLTLLVVLLGVPPVGVLTFFLAGVMAKHMTHAVPTTLLGIPGDTLAVPLLPEAGMLRRLGVPHVALHKALSGAVLAAFLAVPIAVGFASLLTPFAAQITAAAPYVFPVAAVLIAWFSRGRWGAVLGLLPLVVLFTALQRFVTEQHGSALTISFFLGIAIGPLVADLFRSTAPPTRAAMLRAEVPTVRLAPAVKGWSGVFPNPLRVLDRRQIGYTAATAGVSSLTFVLSPVAVTVLMGELVSNRVKHAYHRLTTTIAVKNGVTESTYIAEALIPIVAVGLPLSPMAAGPAAALYNAPPRFTIDTATGQVDNLHTQLATWQFLVFGLLAVAIAAAVVFPLTMTYARAAAGWVTRKLSHEAIVGTLAGLVVVISVYEGGVWGLLVVLTVGLFGGYVGPRLGMHAGVQFMAFYTALLFVPLLLG